jgi:cytochrome c oxidase subunit 4
MAEHPVHPTEALDELDPHHESHAHGHVIVRPTTLVAVLVTLLFLTGLTVGAAHVEGWISETWHIHVPSLFNACIALSIAVVKAVLVFLFFMQLKYDSPLNSIIMGFCFFAVGLFLFFSMIDLGNRAVIYPYKSGEIQLGGLGIATEREVKDYSGNVEKDASGNPIKIGINTNNEPIVQWARERRIHIIGELAALGKLDPPLAPDETPDIRYKTEKARAHAESRGAHHEGGPILSNANLSRAPKPLGPELYADRKSEPEHGEK